MTRVCDLALLAHHLRAALGYAMEYILKEEGVDGE